MSLLRFSSRNHPQQTAKRGYEMFPEPESGFAITDSVDDRGTDPDLFRELDVRFNFTLDAAASHANHLCERYYTLEDDGLTSSWFGARVWCNPPYSDIAPWVRKAWVATDGVVVGRAELVVMLLPANRTEQGWWQDLVEPHRDRGFSFRTEFLRGRRRFVMPGSDRIGPNERPPFGSVLLIWSAVTDAPT